MRKRREARERALQFLFQCDQNPPENLLTALDHFWHTQRLTEFMEAHGPTWGERVDLPAPTEEETATRLFADPLIKGTLERCQELDDIIRKHAKNWDLHRMAVVDRNVMRLAIFEMLYREDIPPIVSINEAVDIAKRFSTADSGKFVNGILDKVKAGILRPARTAKDSNELASELTPRVTESGVVFIPPVDPMPVGSGKPTSEN